MTASKNPGKYPSDIHAALIEAHRRFREWHANVYLKTADGQTSDHGETRLFTGSRSKAQSMRMLFLGLIAAWEHTQHHNAQIALDLAMVIKGPSGISATNKLGHAFADQEVWHVIAYPRISLWTQSALIHELSKAAIQQSAAEASRPVRSGDYNPAVFTPSMRQDIADRMIQDMLNGKPFATRTEPASPSEEERQAAIAKLYEIPEQPSSKTVDTADPPGHTNPASQSDVEPNPDKEQQ